MEQKIRQLDPQIIGLIAAGEVVERPALAIKELIENSMDAQATSISVEIKDGGLTSFRVTDNGMGIARGDLRLAFARHATSKLRSAEQLEAIDTLGFRGEALASIAAVAKVTLTSRPRGTDEGASIEIEGGHIQGIQEAASPEGTSITVRELFYNTPARLKFLKKPATEAGHVSDLIARMMIARPDISMRLVSNGKQVYRSVGDGRLMGVLSMLWGRETAQGLVPIRGHAAGCYWEGFLGVGDAARAGRSHQTFILNGRYVRSALLAQAVEAACRERVIVGRNPVFALHATLDAHSVDVNVHPNKLEVRFRQEQLLYEGLMQLIRAALRPAASHESAEPTRPSAQPPSESRPALAAAPLAAPSLTIPVASRQAPELREGAAARALPSLASAARDARVPTLPQPSTPPPIQARKTQVPHALRPTVEPLAEAKDVQMPTLLRPTDAPSAETSEQLPLFAEESTSKPRVVGIAFETYILVEQGDRLFVVDQHAAHERILFDRFEAQMERGGASQPLLVPLVVSVTHREAQLLEEHREALSSVGFEWAEFGERTIRVQAVPVVLGQAQADMIPAFLAALEGFQAAPTEEKRREALIQLACKKAIKAGDRLAEGAVEALLAQMEAGDCAPTCPHGRPICIAMTRRELDKRFKRTT